MVNPLPPSPSYLQRPIIPVEDPGKGPGPLFLNQTAVEGSKTTFGDRPHYPPPPPPSRPLSRGLDLASCTIQILV